MADENRRLTDKIALRLPEGMRDRIAAAAERNNRSTNSEIVARLERSFEDDEQLTEVSEKKITSEIELLRAQIRLEAMERKQLEERVLLLERR